MDQTGFDQHQNVDYATGAPVTVVERVDGFKLIMRDCHAHQWIDSIFGVNE
jgi:hypothetical protein